MLAAGPSALLRARGKAVAVKVEVRKPNGPPAFNNVTVVLGAIHQA